MKSNNNCDVEKFYLTGVKHVLNRIFISILTLLLINILESM